MERLILKTPCLSPSLLAADQARIFGCLAQAEAIGAPLIHIDVMDGKFVPNVSFSAEFVKKIAPNHHLLNDTHLMMDEPWKHVCAFAEAGSNIITFHIESCPDEDTVHKTIAMIHEAGAYCGLSIKPKTLTGTLRPFLAEIDLVLLMSVEPGLGGQPFMPETITRAKQIKALMAETRSHAYLEVDGGINEITGPECLKAGVDILVSGTFLYGHGDFFERAKRLIP